MKQKSMIVRMIRKSLISYTSNECLEAIKAFDVMVWAKANKCSFITVIHGDNFIDIYLI